MSADTSTVFKYVLQSETEPDEVILCTSDLDDLNYNTNLSDIGRDADKILIDSILYKIENIAVQVLENPSTQFLPNQTGNKSPYRVIITYSLLII